MAQGTNCPVPQLLTGQAGMCTSFVQLPHIFFCLCNTSRLVRFTLKDRERTHSLYNVSGTKKIQITLLTASDHRQIDRFNINWRGSLQFSFMDNTHTFHLHSCKWVLFRAMAMRLGVDSGRQYVKPCVSSPTLREEKDPGWKLGVVGACHCTDTGHRTQCWPQWLQCSLGLSAPFSPVLSDPAQEKNL